MKLSNYQIIYTYKLSIPVVQNELVFVHGYRSIKFFKPTIHLSRLLLFYIRIKSFSKFDTRTSEPPARLPFIHSSIIHVHMGKIEIPSSHKQQCMGFPSKQGFHQRKSVLLTVADVVVLLPTGCLFVFPMMFLCFVSSFDDWFFTCSFFIVYLRIS